MSGLVFCGVTADEAEQTIAGIWLSIERFGFPSPRLSFAFEANRDRLSLRVEFEEESIAMIVVRSLSTRSLPGHVGLAKPPVLDENWQMVSHDSAP